MTVRRMKTYSGESGFVYQYYFLESQPRRRLLSRGGTAFLFSVSSDRKSYYTVEVMVEETALQSWEQSHGRSLTDTEKYAAAKMRLFRAFDETPSPEELRHVKVDANNIESLLEPLRLDE
ncbi:MAG: hypothetical protein HYX72_03735 [Acidobacteria bacterium]|nr:hypothetical protein [Acidobacteriota bacterium]